MPAAPQRLAQSTLCAAAWPPAPTGAAMATATQAPSTTLAGRVDKRRRRATIIQAAGAPVRNDVACGGGGGGGGTSSRGREGRGKQTGSQRGDVARATRPRLDADWASLASVVLRPLAALCHPPQDHSLRREVVVAARSAALLQTGRNRSAAGRWRCAEGAPCGASAQRCARSTTRRGRPRGGTKVAARIGERLRSEIGRGGRPRVGDG